VTEAATAETVETFTAGDGYRWRYRHYPAAEPQARVVCLHGIQSHSGWYQHSCRRLAQAGYDVSFLDRRGSGLNEQDRGDAPGFRRLLDDVAEFLRPLRGAADAKPPAAPLFLLAISWGGKLGAALQRRHPGLVDGLALLCPGFCPRVAPSRKERLKILWARLTAPRRLFPVPLNDPELFTATAHWQQFVRDDPLALRQATARLLIESARLDGYLRLWAAGAVRAPVLLLLAEHDRIIDNARTRAFVGRFPAADKEVIEYPGAHHTLEFEPNPGPWLNDLLGWLGRQTAAVTTGCH
jgi:alpha-beta hydrolase superfamily lysophospholipase